MTILPPPRDRAIEVAKLLQGYDAAEKLSILAMTMAAAAKAHQVPPDVAIRMVTEAIKIMAE